MSSQVVKLYLRIRNSKEALPYTLNHTTIKFDSESVTFQKIFLKDSSQQDIYEELGKPLVDNLLRGINGIFLAFGTSGSGKTYSLLGETNFEGLLLKALEDVFARAKILKSKKSISIVLSCFEIYNDRIKDLAKVLTDGKQRFGEESLEIREHQGNVYIDNLAVTHIESLQEAMHMINEGKRQRRSQAGNNENLSHVHTVFKITVAQKEMNMTKSGVLTLVDLADSDSGEDSINKTLNSLKNLLIDLQQGHHASSDECTLSKILASNFKHHCLTSVLFHINPSQSRQSITTLNYANLCYLHSSNATAENLVFKSHQQTNRLKKLQDEIRELKHQIDKSQEHHELKLRSFGDIIGFNIEVENATINPTSKERKMIEAHLDSVIILDEVENRNRRLEAKLSKNTKMFEEIQKFEQKNREKNQAQIKALEDQIRGVKIQIIELSDKIQDSIRKKTTTKAEELQQVLLANHMKLEENAAVIHNLPFTLQSIASDMRAMTDYKDMGRAELETELSQKFDLSESAHSRLMNKTKVETDSALKYLDQEIRRFENECNVYIRQKISTMSELQKEAVSLYNIFQAHEKLIKEIEIGSFNGGIKPIYITVHDLPKPPQREKFPYLFKALKEKGVLTSQKDNNFIKINNNLFTKKYVQDTQKNFSTVKSTFQLIFPEKTQKESLDKSDQTLENEVKPEFAEEFERKQSLRRQATDLQKQVAEKSKKLKTLKQNATGLELKVIDSESELKKINADRDRHKDFYAVLMKNKIENRVVIESQKRLMDKYTFITEQISSRPSTGKKRPVTASGIRLGLARK